ncbi:MULTISPECIES: anti-sigma regulatory factor [unclassified Streptomyces]|uniref:anti-sigma regulatory factor n=1 Tax=unclassified Streptomyces TaxID=2593676 RepID=UPI0006AFF259|nr:MULTISPECIES: anti-sigma regulatory factor [unclassified Streptomyces]
MKEYPADEASREEVSIFSSGDVVKARQTVRVLAQRAGLSLVNQTKLVTAASELGRNTLIYGGGGTAHAVIVRDVARVGVRVSFSDTGPGIPDIEQALTDGWTSGNGMGLGLSGARRLVDEFELDSAPGAGTTVTVLKWAR